MSKIPLSVEELREKAREAATPKKVVFLSKEERTKIALEKRKVQVQSNQIKRATDTQLFSSLQTPTTTKNEVVSTLPTDELNQIRAQYIPSEKPKKKTRKQNDKKFVFDWDTKEDTFQDLNPIYQKRHQATFYGRSVLAGFDRQDLKLKTKKTGFDDRHWSKKDLQEMTERDWRIFKEDYSITVKVPNPLRSWKESSIPSPVLDVIDKIGYKEPTPIQRQAIPIAIENRDIIGVAETGSGKTASFVIPMLCFIQNLPPLDFSNHHLGPYALILAPTRELALQIEQEATKFSSALGFNCVSIVGGHSIDSQSKNLGLGAHIVIATPGRLRDIIERRIMVLGQCTYLVLDEADRMIDMGFESDLNYILDSMPVSNLKPDYELDEATTDKTRNAYRQTVMFSATMPPSVERLAKIYLRRPINVTVGQVGQVVDRIEQRVEFIPDEQKKLKRLIQILSSKEFDNPIIIFVNQRKTSEVVSRGLETLNLRCSVLHGGKSQDQREAALAQFKDGTKGILIATDVAGRGIDVKNVSLVVNFDMAKNIQDYTHRIGRTGRAGKNGCAISFLNNDDVDVMYDLKKLLEKSSLSTVPQELIRHEAAQKPVDENKYKRKSEETLYSEGKFKRRKDEGNQ